METIKAKLSRVRVIDVLSTMERLAPCPDMVDAIKALGALVVIEEQILAAFNSLEMIEPEFPTGKLSRNLAEHSGAWRKAVLAVEGARTEVAELRSQIVRTEFRLAVSSEEERAADEVEYQGRRAGAAA